MITGKILLLSLFLLFLTATISPHTAQAIPQFSLATGNRCINCHVAVQGAGLRDELGRYSTDGTGLTKAQWQPLGDAGALLDGALLVGADVRVQMARSHQSPDADRRFFPMQAALYSLYRPSGPVQLEGSYNFGPKKFDGQQSWTGSVLLQPSFDFPQLRLGYFQPSIGIRYDDHTTLVRQTADVTGATTLIAPNYAEWGAELHYYKPRWLDLTAGVYNARSLAENTVADSTGQLIPLIENRDRASLLGRAAFWPKLQQGRLNLHAGGSHLVNDDFSLTNLFGGVGIRDRFTLLVDYARSDKADVRETRNLSVDLAYHGLRSIMLTVRGETGITTLPRTGGDVEMRTRQAVLGVQVFLSPQVIFRPEYRLVDTEIFRSGRYAAQLHLFY